LILIAGKEGYKSVFGWVLLLNTPKEEVKTMEEMN
jgi:hypothetical protein